MILYTNESPRGQAGAVLRLTLRIIAWSVPKMQTKDKRVISLASQMQTKDKRVISLASQMQTKDKRVISLASQICALLRGHPDRWEALEAIGVAKTLFRPADGGVTDETLQSPSVGHESLSVTQ
jgi:hypothetical protein